MDAADHADTDRAVWMAALERKVTADLARQAQVESATHCQDCGEPIPEGRRKAMPGCKRCVRCA